MPYRFKRRNSRSWFTLAVSSQTEVLDVVQRHDCVAALPLERAEDMGPNVLRIFEGIVPYREKLNR